MAVKVMDRARIKAASIEREWTVLEHLGAHPYVVQFKGSYLTAADVTFVMEMYELGSMSAVSLTVKYVSGSVAGVCSSHARATCRQ